MEADVLQYARQSVGPRIWPFLESSCAKDRQGIDDGPS